MRSYMNQFTWGHLVSLEIQAVLAIDDGMMDDSWGNDVSPKIIFGDDLNIWIDHPDQDQREFPDRKQYLVEMNETDRETSETLPITLLETDDFNEVVKLLREWIGTNCV